MCGDLPPRPLHASVFRSPYFKYREKFPRFAFVVLVLYKTAPSPPHNVDINTTTNLIIPVYQFVHIFRHEIEDCHIGIFYL